MNVVFIVVDITKTVDRLQICMFSSDDNPEQIIYINNARLQ